MTAEVIAIDRNERRRQQEEQLADLDQQIALLESERTQLRRILGLVAVASQEQL